MIERMSVMHANDWSKGIVRTDAGQLIAYPRMTFQEFISSPLGATAEVPEQRGIYRYVEPKEVVISGYECGAGLYFTNDVVDQLSIVVTDKTAKRFGFVTGYASPPDGPEVAFLEKWVEREVGKKPPVSFSWGTIGQVYDSVACFARILFDYR